MKQRTRKKPPAPARALPFSSRSKRSPHLSPPSQVNSEGPSPPAPDINSPGARSFVFSLSDPTLFDSSARESCFPESDTLYEPEPPTPQEWTIPEMKLVPFQQSSKPDQRTTTSTFSVLPSLQLLSIPRPLPTLLSPLSPEHSQVSDTTSSELDLSLYAFPSVPCLDVAGADLIFQPPCRATAVEALWDISPRSQAGCYTTWRPLELRCSSILHSCLGWTRDVFLCWYQKLTCNGPAARETRSAVF